MFDHIAVFGLGLLGGSVCRGVRRRYPGVRLSAYGRSGARLEAALREGAIDAAGEIEAASLRGVDLAIVSTPVEASMGIISRILSDPELGPNALVIDVGSVKDAVVRSTMSHERSSQFIGCHPMAGSEKMGYRNSSGELFEGASVIITPHRGNREDDVVAVREFWESLGAVTAIVPPEMHDRIVSCTSHLPHMVAAALVRVIDDSLRKGGMPERVDLFIGGGFRDTTRVASGSPEMWRDISALNRENIMSAVDRMIDELALLKKLMEEDPSRPDAVGGYLEAAKAARDGLL